MFAKSAIYLFCLLVAIESKTLNESDVQKNNSDVQNQGESVTVKSNDDPKNEVKSKAVDDLLLKSSKRWELFLELRKQLKKVGSNVSETDIDVSNLSKSLNPEDLKDILNLNETANKNTKEGEESQSKNFFQDSKHLKKHFMEKYVEGISKYLVIYEAEGSHQMKCVGLVVDEFWVMTAQHCGRLGRFVDTGYNRHRIQTIIPYINVNMGDNSIHFDLQLLKLKKPLSFSKILQPILLPTTDFYLPGEDASVIVFTLQKNAPIIGGGVKLFDEDCNKELENTNLAGKVFCLSVTQDMRLLENCEDTSNMFSIRNGHFIGMSAFKVECGGSDSVAFLFKVKPILNWIKSYIK